MAYLNGGRIVLDGLVLALDAGDKNSYPGSGTTWYDYSGNGNNGTLINGPTFSSANGGNIIFDGTDDYLKIDYLTSYLNNSTPVPFTISIWVKFTSLVSRSGVWGKNDAIEFGPINTADITLWSANSSTAIAYSISNSALLTYNCIVLTNSSGGSNLYINGTSVASGVAVSGTSGYDFTVMTGAFDPPGSSYSGGYVSNFTAYNRVLSAAEIAQNYNAIKSHFNLI